MTISNVPQVPLDTLVEASEEIVRALTIRAKYMAVSGQSFSSLTAKFLHYVDETKTFDTGLFGAPLSHNKKTSIQGVLGVLSSTDYDITVLFMKVTSSMALNIIRGFQLTR